MNSETYESEKNEDADRWEDYLRTGKAVSQEAMLDWLKQLIAGAAAPLPECDTTYPPRPE